MSAKGIAATLSGTIVALAVGLSRRIHERAWRQRSRRRRQRVRQGDLERIHRDDRRLAKRPKVRTTAVNPPKDPLVRGNCGIVRCQQVYDFIDVVLDRKGRPWAAMVDGCAPKAETPGLCSNLGMGIVATIER